MINEEFLDPRGWPVQIIESMPFVWNDGGRADAGYKGTTGDCVTRAIAIATGRPYKQVYDDMHREIKEANERRGKRRAGWRGNSPRNGVPRPVIRKYMYEIGWEWVPTMQIGSGCQVHLRAGELPEEGNLVVSLSKHIVAVIDGVIHDLGDPSRGGTRCVYGYWREA